MSPSQGEGLLRSACPDELLGEQAELLPPVKGLRVGERRARLCHLWPPFANPPFLASFPQELPEIER